MHDLIKQMQAERAYKKSVQEMMDEKMCRPGYRWHGEPLNRCLPAAVPEDYKKPEPPTTDPPNPEPPRPDPPVTEPPVTPEEAIAAEIINRKAKK